MELFKKIAELLSEGEDLNIVARKKADGRLVVSVLLNTGDKDVTIPPFILRGTPDELDGGFIAALEPTLVSASGLVVDTKAAKDAVDKAVAAKKKQDETKAPAAKKSSSKKAADKPAATSEASLIPDTETQDEDENEGDNEVAEETQAPEPEAVQEEHQEEQQAPEAAPAPVVEAPAPKAEPAPAQKAVSEAQQQPSAPEAKEAITEDINTLWKRGKEYYAKGDYKNAKNEFEKCRAIAKPNQYPSIDKAIDNCMAKISSNLFNSES